MPLSDYAIVLIVCVALTAPLDIFLKLHVYARFSKYLKAVWFPATSFLVWDVYATAQGHWAFSSQHTSGVKLFGLPLEEYLFFFIIPLCAVLSLQAIRKLHPESSKKNVKVFVWPMFIISYFTIGMVVENFFNQSRDTVYPDRTFATYTLLTLVAIVALFTWVFSSKGRFELLKKLDYFYALAICYFFMIFVNGYLTKLTDPVVTYAANSGPRVFFNIPVEDFLYGGVLLVWTMLNYDKEKIKK